MMYLFPDIEFAFLFFCKGDGAGFMGGPVRVMAGYDHLIYGSKVVTSGGKDGILPGDRRLNPNLEGFSSIKARL